ncbi:serine hydroxymethyltransferase [Methylobacter sp. BlB1]|uniref:serine hydroxymethyltransferase n=1 Tax=Methylobacter sp. BlB1 TaxID=2785914 RepID=UPI001892DC8F|nr:serine hydroxymethyltransferase [Methylobacter sp. BlB1]MBF6649620.1 serine hydroxymethyltransferase [Methylobacter sp. BlB1]
MTKPKQDFFSAGLRESDPEIWQAIAGELNRQHDQIELIASENFVSRAVLQAQGSILTNKTVEGYPGGRYYGGAEFADRVEQLAIDRACRLFNCRYANVQPHSGSNANQATFLALLGYSDTILSMDVAAGGHISHGHPATQTGRRYRIVSYGVSREDECIDYAEVRRLAQAYRPKLIIAGGSAYSRIIDFPRLRAIADEVGAYLLVDMAHFAGLVATGYYPDPFPYAHVVTTTTYKSLRGARGGIILTNDETIAKKIAASVFPGVQGSLLLHAIAGKAVCLGEALQPEFKAYNAQVLANAKALAESLAKAGYRIVSGQTDTGLMLVDLTAKGLDGACAVVALERAGLTCNKNLIPFDPLPAEIASGIRLSANAGTTRGFGTAEFAQIAGWIAEVLDGLANNAGNAAVEAHVREQVSALCRAFPIYSEI